jgi:hypothetical protein
VGRGVRGRESEMVDLSADHEQSLAHYVLATFTHAGSRRVGAAGQGGHPCCAHGVGAWHKQVNVGVPCLLSEHAVG